MVRTSRQRLEPQGAGASEKVEHPRAGDRVSEAATHEDVEQAFAHTVRRGAQMGPGIALAHSGQGVAPKAPADDPHALRSGFRSVAASASTAGSGDLPASIRRLPTM